VFGVVEGVECSTQSVVCENHESQVDAVNGEDACSSDHSESLLSNCHGDMEPVTNGIDIPGQRSDLGRDVTKRCSDGDVRWTRRAAGKKKMRLEHDINGSQSTWLDDINNDDEVGQGDHCNSHRLSHTVAAAGDDDDVVMATNGDAGKTTSVAELIMDVNGDCHRSLSSDSTTTFPLGVTDDYKTQEQSSLKANEQLSLGKTWRWLSSSKTQDQLSASLSCCTLGSARPSSTSLNSVASLRRHADTYQFTPGQS